MIPNSLPGNRNPGLVYKSFKSVKINVCTLRGVTILTNVVWATLCLTLSPPGHPYFWVKILVKMSLCFFYSIPDLCHISQKKNSSLPIPGKTSRFPEEFCVSPETDLVLRVVTAPPSPPPVTLSCLNYWRMWCINGVLLVFVYSEQPRIKRSLRHSPRMTA